MKKNKKNFERGQLAQSLILDLKKSGKTQRQIAKMLDVSQDWVLKHLHSSTQGVPSDFIWRKIMAVNAEINHEKNKRKRRYRDSEAAKWCREMLEHGRSTTSIGGDVGVSYCTIWNWSVGQTTPKGSRLESLARVYNQWRDGLNGN